MAVTNAISAIVVVGAILVAGSDAGSSLIGPRWTSEPSKGLSSVNHHSLQEDQG